MTDKPDRFAIGDHVRIVNLLGKQTHVGDIANIERDKCGHAWAIINDSQPYIRSFSVPLHRVRPLPGSTPNPT